MPHSSAPWQFRRLLYSSRCSDIPRSSPLSSWMLRCNYCSLAYSFLLKSLTSSLSGFFFLSGTLFLFCKNRRQRLRVRRSRHTVFGNDACNQLMIRHIKCRIEDLDALRCHALLVPHFRDFSAGRSDLDLARSAYLSRSLTSARRYTPAHRNILPQPPLRTYRSYFAASPFAATRSHPTNTALTQPFFMTVADILSQISVTSTPAECSSNAVSLAPCNSGLVSSANT